MKKLECFYALDCDDHRKRIVCTPGEIAKHHEYELSAFCGDVKNISKDIDTVEIITPKGKLKTEYKSNGIEVLDIETM